MIIKKEAGQTPKFLGHLFAFCFLLVISSPWSKGQEAFPSSNKSRAFISLFNKHLVYKTSSSALTRAENSVASLNRNSRPISLKTPSALFKAHQRLQQRIETLLASPLLRRTQFSIFLCWAGTGEIIFEHQANSALVPASNMKLVTTAAAISLLGLDFEFITRVSLASQSLYIIGSGDPLLGDKETDEYYGRQPHWLLEDIASRLKLKGINSIENIIIDTSVFDQERVHPSWPQNVLLQKYACEVSGFNYNGNCVEISATNRQGKTFLFLDPKTNYLRLINATTAVSSPENWFSVKRTNSPQILRVTGEINSKAGPYAVTVTNPALFFGTLLKEHLAKKGIAVEGEVKEARASIYDEDELIAEYRTSLLDVLRRTNKDSLGLAAESLFKTLGARENPDHKEGSWEAGRKAITRFLLKLNLAENEFFISDGNGLSRENRLSSHVLASLLFWLYRQPFWPTFESTLAVGGIDGTLENVFRERTIRGRVVAKTGYINGVRALSGIIHTHYGDIIFSFLANNASNFARTTINNIVKEVAQWADSLPSTSEMNQSR